MALDRPGDDGMISDVLLDAALKIGQYRKDYPFYDEDPRTARWLDVTITGLETLAEVVGQPPPPDDRTWQGECRDCHEITTIRLDTLCCGACRETSQDLIAQLAEAVTGLPEQTPEEVAAASQAEFDAAHSEWLAEDALRIVTHLRQLDRADRDHILDAIHRSLLEAR
jgi:hypothetical protein